MFNNTKYRQGFTLVEMLIVIAIIAVLSTLILRGIGGALPKSRDARRIGDLRNVQSSLELYYSKQGTYPKAENWDDLQTEMKVVLGENFKLPKDPSGGTYYYCPGAESIAGAVNSYVLGAQLEVTSSTDETLTGITCGQDCGKLYNGGVFYCVGM